ncbi:CrcB-like protein-domain-containing protein [Aspergillus tamarii]|uniref:CrcB-like protein-domain-containing protein n=1 Tax=Aspergillus tamarii TaxID=41984 RepID=A0A5N6V9T5_ASPTM|nr:CrcB-like protein-domain-containing protein [Aspergillus tamarii]
MQSTSPMPANDTEQLPETQAPPPTTEEASQRQAWSSEGYGLPPTSDKPPYGPVEPTPSRREPGERPLSKHATHLFTLSYLVFFAIFGTLARLGLQALTGYPGAPVVTGVLWANVGGSLLMGFFLEDKNLFREEWGDVNQNNSNGTGTDPSAESKRHKSIKKTIPLYIGLTTGFCGCFTSFSSFIRDVFLALSNDLSDPSAPNGGYSFMTLVAVILITVALSLGGLIFGAHLALALDPLTPSFPFRFTRRFIDPVFIVLGWGCWLGAVFLAIWPPDRHGNVPEFWRGRAVFAVVFAPLGCFLRYYVSLVLNARLPAFPLGTFAVNIFGTIILAMCYDLQHVDGIGASSVGSGASSSILTSCQVLAGIMDGFCGSATTISTWVAELNGLSRRRHAYFYGTVSIGVALGFFVIITGSLRWTRGFVEPVCK